MSRADGVAWCATIFGRSGYAEESRNAILALDSVGVPVYATPLYWNAWQTGLPPAMVERIERLIALDLPERFVYVAHFHPNRYQRHPRATYHVARTMAETTAIPPDWVPRCNAMDEVWVPSESNVEVFTRAGVARDKVRAMPECLPTDLYDPSVRPVEIPQAHGFVFLSVFAWGRRKGWDVLVRAYVEEFAPQEDVTLVLKTSATYDTSTSGQIRELRAFIRHELGRDLERCPRLVVLDLDPGSGGMPAVYAAADAFVLASRGEGWGRPYMEAMAMGLPTIGTRWSGQLAFMNDANSYLIDCELVDVNDAGRKEGSWWTQSRYAQGQSWAEPSVPHLRQLMRHVFERRDETRAIGARARQHIVGNFSWARVGTLMRDRLIAVGAL